MKFIKNLIFWLGLILVTAVVWLVIWLCLPVPVPSFTEFMPEETFMIASLIMDNREPEVKKFLDSILTSDQVREEKAIRYGLSFCLPLKVTVFFSNKVIEDDDDYPCLILMQSPRLVKLFKILQVLRIKIFSSYYFRVVQNTLIISEDAAFLEKAVVGNEELSISPMEMESKQLIFFAADNQEGSFTGLVDKLNKKLSYAVLTSSGELKSLGGEIRVVDDRLVFILIFQGEGKRNFQKIEGDLIFVKGLCKRLCRANKLVCTEEITVDKNGRSELRMEIKGFPKAF